MSRLTTIALALAVAATAGACAHQPPPAPAARPLLTGRWVMPRDSAGATRDTAVAAAPDIIQPTSEREGRRGGRGGGYGGDRDERGSGGGPHYDPEALGAAMAAVRRGEGRVNIALTDSTVHLDFADGSYFDLPTDGHMRDDIWRNVGRIQASARWTPAGLVFERKTEDGVTVTQTYARAAGSKQVVVTTVLKGQTPRPVTFRRVLEPATS